MSNLQIKFYIVHSVRRSSVSTISTKKCICRLYFYKTLLWRILIWIERQLCAFFGWNCGYGNYFLILCKDLHVFNVQGSVHRKYIPFDIFPTRLSVTQFIYFWKTDLRVLCGISTHLQEHTTLFTVSGTCQTVTATCNIAAGSSNGLTSARYCKYSFVCPWWWVEIPPEKFRAVFQK